LRERREEKRVESLSHHTKAKRVSRERERTEMEINRKN